MNFEWAAQLTCAGAASSTPALCKGASLLRAAQAKRGKVKQVHQPLHCDYILLPPFAKQPLSSELRKTHSGEKSKSCNQHCDYARPLQRSLSLSPLSRSFESTQKSQTDATTVIMFYSHSLERNLSPIFSASALPLTSASPQFDNS